MVDWKAHTRGPATVVLLEGPEGPVWGQWSINGGFTDHDLAELSKVVNVACDENGRLMPAAREWPGRNILRGYILPRRRRYTIRDLATIKQGIPCGFWRWIEQ